MGYDKFFLLCIADESGNRIPIDNEESGLPSERFLKSLTELRNMMINGNLAFSINLNCYRFNL